MGNVIVKVGPPPPTFLLQCSLTSITDAYLIHACRSSLLVVTENKKLEHFAIILTFETS